MSQTYNAENRDPMILRVRPVRLSYQSDKTPNLYSPIPHYVPACTSRPPSPRTTTSRIAPRVPGRASARSARHRRRQAPPVSSRRTCRSCSTAALAHSARCAATVARANPHARQLATGAVPALLLFSGPDAYITPNWYPLKAEHGRVVPDLELRCRPCVRLRGPAR